MKRTIAKLLAGDTNYVPNCVYVAFKNVTSADDTIDDPTSEAAEDIQAYFNSMSGNVDYLKVPLVIKPTITEEGSGVKVEFMVMIPGSGRGEHGLEFSSDSHSTIFASSLVSELDSATNSEFNTFQYITPDAQLATPGTGTIGLVVTLVI